MRVQVTGSSHPDCSEGVGTCGGGRRRGGEGARVAPPAASWCPGALELRALRLRGGRPGHGHSGRTACGRVGRGRAAAARALAVLASIVSLSPACAGGLPVKLCQTEAAC